MTTLENLIDAAERLEQLAVEARAQCVAARARLEELRHQDYAEHAQLLAGLAHRGPSSRSRDDDD
jgi:hypothetical protein